MRLASSRSVRLVLTLEKEGANANISVSGILFGARFEGDAARGGIETPRGCRAINQGKGWGTGGLLLCLWERRLRNHCGSAEQRGRSSLVDGRQCQRSRALANNSTDHARGG